MPDRRAVIRAALIDGVPRTIHVRDCNCDPMKDSDDPNCVALRDALAALVEHWVGPLGSEFERLARLHHDIGQGWHTPRTFEACEMYVCEDARRALATLPWRAP